MLLLLLLLLLLFLFLFFCRPACWQIILLASVVITVGTAVGHRLAIEKNLAQVWK